MIVVLSEDYKMVQGTRLYAEALPYEFPRR